LLPLIAWLNTALGRRYGAARIALSHTRRPSGRHRLAAAALVCAIGMTSGMAILVASFDLTMRGWIRRTLQADLYISSAGAQSASSRNLISARAADAITSLPAVARSSRLVSRRVAINGVETNLSGVDLGSPSTRPNTTWVDAPRDNAIYDPARNADLALVSESFTERFQVKRGGVIRVPTPTGARELRIAGVFADYGNERGSILADRAHVREWYHEDSVTNLALWLKPGENADAVRAELLKQYPGLSVFTNVKLRAEVLRIFRQTFSITYALEVIGVIVAIVGLALTLISVLLDRRDELTTLRALGFTRGEIATATSLEGLSVSLCATLAGLLLSFGLGWLLIYVINKQSFGWTLGFAVPWLQLLGLGATILFTGGIVSYFVGKWGAALSADREE
jgi:putative ABC transport system permease protein